MKSTGTGTAAGMSITVNAVAETVSVSKDVLASSTIMTSGQALGVFDLPGGTSYAATEAIGQSIFGFMVFNKATSTADDANIDAYFNAAYAIH